MAQVLGQRPPTPTPDPTSNSTRISSVRSQHITISGAAAAAHSAAHINLSWESLQQSVKCNSRFSCLFSDNRKQEQAKKALEGALDGKKGEFEKWDKEIKRREQAGGGGDFGGGGWFRWNRWFGGSDDDHFWQEAQQISITILAIVVMFLIVAKGDVMLAIVLNPLLFVFRGARDGLAFVTSLVLKKLNPASKPNFTTASKEDISAVGSARESVIKKWGSN